MKNKKKKAVKALQRLERKKQKEIARRKKLIKIPLLIFSSAIGLLLVYNFLLVPVFSNFDMSNFAALQGGPSVQGDLSALENYPFEINPRKPTFVYLGSGTCLPCKMMAPILEELSSELSNSANIVNIDLGKYHSAGSDFDIRSIPTLIFYNTRGQEVSRRMGFTAKEEVIEELKNAGMR